MFDFIEHVLIQLCMKQKWFWEVNSRMPRSTLQFSTEKSSFYKDLRYDWYHTKSKYRSSYRNHGKKKKTFRDFN